MLNQPVKVQPGRILRGLFLALFTVLASWSCASAGTVTIAVAANFAAPLKSLVKEFEANTPHQVRMVVGSTGQLYTQIINGAPFDVFLAADQERPDRLIREEFARKEDRFTYATGRLVLYSRTPGHENHVLPPKGPYSLAIANPKLAPYGAAADDVLRHFGIADEDRRFLRIGKNISQAFQFVETGNAYIGLVALSQVKGKPEDTYRIVEAALHRPIRQDAVLFAAALDNPAAVKFFDFLKSAEAELLIRGFGYEAGDADGS